MKRIATFILLLLCAAHVHAAKLRVSSFSSVLTEVATEVGGDLVEVTGHVKPGTDPHEFEPRAADLKAVSSADIVLLSAKHLEGYVGKLRDVTQAAVVEVGAKLPSLKLTVQHGDHAHDGEDPHWWHSVKNIQRASRYVRDELTKLRPESKAAFAANCDRYVAKLDTLQRWVQAKVAELPRDQRKLVTNHDAFGYFAKEYGFTVMPIAGLSKNDQPGSKKVAEIIGQIKKAGVKAVFSEDVANPKVIQEVTREAGAKFGGELLSDGLGAKPRDSVEAMFRHNVTTIVEALK